MIATAQIYRIEKPREVADRKQLVAQLSDFNNLAEISRRLKGFLRSGEEEIARRFRQSRQLSAGRKAAGERAYLIDQIIRTLYDIAVEKLFPNANPTQGERLTLIALGGYGRGELAPFSDIDLLFIQGYRSNAWAEQIVEFILYRLWDLGLKPGYAVRTREEAVHWAASDLIAQTSLLEARYLAGDAESFEQLADHSRRNFLDVAAKNFSEAKLAERNQRLERFGQSRYNLQPNIKEGKGGLRDLHLLRWLARPQGPSSMEEMVKEGYLSAGEAKQFSRAEDVLWLYRTHLHYLAGRAEERLTFDLQAELARQLRLRARLGLMPVERLMRFYFRNARKVGKLVQSFLIRFMKPQVPAIAGEIDGFLLSPNGLEVKTPDHFQKTPRDLLRIFAKAQEESKHIELNTLSLAQKAGYLITEKWRGDPVINSLFLKIITSPHEPEFWLHRLNEAGILGRFLPDFGRIMDQVQFDMYHHYTVDEHTIRAIGELNQLLLHGLAAEMPQLVPLAERFNRDRPALLFLAVFFHDIAKGRDRDHSEVGAEIALELGPRFGLNDCDVQTLSWLVRHHLLMSNIAFRRNLDDVKTIQSFAAKVENTERLDLLLLLTVADIRAVGPKTWTSWKGQLLCDLYLRTQAELQMPESAMREHQILETKDRLRQALAGQNIATDAIEAYIRALSPGYILSFPDQELLHHYDLMTGLAENQDSVVVEFLSDSAKAITSAIVICQDRKGLVAQLAGAFALTGANIINAQIFTLHNGIALDVFILQNTIGEAFSLHRFSGLEHRVKRVLANPALELARLADMPLYIDPAAAAFPVNPRVHIDNEASDDFTVIEVSGRDKRGLVYGLASQLTSFGCSIASAKVSTFGHRAVDVFYVVGTDGRKMRNDETLKAITSGLMEAMHDSHSLRR